MAQQDSAPSPAGEGKEARQAPPSRRLRFWRGIARALTLSVTLKLPAGYASPLISILANLASNALLGVLVDVRQSNITIEAKIRRASEAMRETSTPIGELEELLKEQPGRLTHLRGEVERYSRLASVGETKARALLHEVEITMDRGKGVERRVGFVIDVIAGPLLFVFGIWAGPHVTHWMGLHK